MRKISLLSAFLIVLIASVSSAAIIWALTSLKVIHSTAIVQYAGDVNIEDFKFSGESEVSVTISTSLVSTPACVITVSGAGISGSKTISAGWSSPTTVTIPITGTLTEGTITIEVTS